MSNPFLPILKIEGNNYDIGLQIGRTFKDNIFQAFEKSVYYKALIATDKKKPDWFDELQRQSKKYSPQFDDEISGIADGADKNYREIGIVNYRHSFELESCSTAAFKDNEKMIIVHNEDHEHIIGKLSFLLHIKLENGNSFIAHAYPGCIPGTSFSFNSKGILMCGNAMPTYNLETGVPQAILARSMLEASTIEDLIEIALHDPRSGGFSYNIASSDEKRMINIETTSSLSDITEITDTYFHANHYVSEGLVKQVSPPRSTERYEWGLKLLSQSKLDGNNLLKILSDPIIYRSKRLAADTPFGQFFNSTLATVRFKLKDGLSLEVFPKIVESDPILFSLDDLV
jgi:predicted choloylglycine hydrolase